MVLYEFRHMDKLDIISKQLSQEPFASMDTDKSTKIKILTVLSSIYLSKAIQETDDKLRDEYFREVRTYFNKSDKIEISEKSTFTLKGFYYFYQNEIRQSSDYFDNAKETDPYYVPCIIGRVGSSKTGVPRVREKEVRGSERPVQTGAEDEPHRSIPNETGAGILLLPARGVRPREAGVRVCIADGRRL